MKLFLFGTLIKTQSLFKKNKKKEEGERVKLD